ncbi:MAG: hypothetical protein WKH64_00485 [Chloroflexia bacterium]
MVEIEGLDVQADGGTHVASTSEVGRIRVVAARARAGSTRGCGSSSRTNESNTCKARP